MKNIDHSLKLVRSASLTLNVVRLCGLNKFGLRHPEPTGTASDSEQHGFDVSAPQLLRFGFIGDLEHAVHTHLQVVFGVPLFLLPIEDYLTCRLDEA